MRTPKIIYKNLRQRALSTILTSCSIALGVALVVAITCLRQQAQDNFDSVAASYELVVGAKGSPLQLVLNTVYHLDVPVGNIPHDYYQTLKNDWRVLYAVPMALGDNYRGFRLVGTEPEYFDRIELKGGKKLAFAQGTKFTGDYQAVLGSAAASETGLILGQKFVAKHGVEDTSVGEEHGEHPCTVVGVLQPTGTPQDRVIFISIGSVHAIHEPDPNAPLTGADLTTALSELPDQPPPSQPNETPKPSPSSRTEHEQEKKHNDHHDDHEQTPSKPSPKHGDDNHGNGEHEDKPTEVTSIILKLKTPAFMFQFHREINKGKVAQAAYPALEVQKLFNIVGTLNRVLLVVSFLVVIVSGVSILVAIYNSLNERRREIAVMRALGARRRTVFTWLLLEAAAVSTLGGLAGLLLGRLILLGLSGIAKNYAGTFTPWKFIRIEATPTLFQHIPGDAVVLASAILLGAVMGLLPAALAYRTNVSANLNA